MILGVPLLRTQNSRMSAYAAVTYLTDEQRRDATQMRDFPTGVKPFGALAGHRAADARARRDYWGAHRRPAKSAAVDGSWSAGGTALGIGLAEIVTGLTGRIDGQGANRALAVHARAGGVGGAGRAARDRRWNRVRNRETFAATSGIGAKHTIAVGCAGTGAGVARRGIASGCTA
jgi:hypothetical protein